MAAKTNSTTARTIYESPEGRVKVVREGNRDFSLYLDGFYTRSYEFAFQAEHEGGVWLTEQAAELTATLADEQADKDAEQADKDAAMEIAEYAAEVRLYCLGLNQFDSIIIDKGEGFNLYLDGTGVFMVEERPGQTHTFTREQTAAICRFFDGGNTQRRMMAVQRAVLIEHGHGELVKIIETAVKAAPALTPKAAVQVKPWIDDDRLSERLGQQVGTLFTCNEGETRVEVCFEHGGPADVFLNSNPGIPLDEVERVLPLLTAILSDPRVQERRALAMAA